MSRPEYPDVREVLPHAGRMALLSRVLAHDAEETVCSVEVQPGTLFSAEDGSVPVWVGIEYMAQCVAAHAGLEGHARGTPPRVGFLIGSRRIETRTPRFEPGRGLFGLGPLIATPIRALVAAAQELRS